MELTLLCYELLKLGSDLVVLERSKKKFFNMIIW